MPPRDETEYETRRQQIIDGALEVFSAKGYEKATNKDIAEAAGVNSAGLIYHYFKDKADLLRHVMEQRAPVLQFLSHTEEQLDRPPEEVLPMFATALIQTANNNAGSKMIKLFIGEALRRPELISLINSIGPGRGIAFLTRYMARQMDLGTLRRMHPGAAARCFIGPIVAYIATREVLIQPDTATLDAQTMVQTLVGVFLQGARPEP